MSNETPQKVSEEAISQVQSLLDAGKTLAEIRKEQPELAAVIDHVEFKERPRPGGCAVLEFDSALDIP